jgi:Ca2+-binding EF-hand superfamily protein
LDEIGQDEFYGAFKESNRFGKVMLMIRGIDRDRNGYVTVNELDDILKEVYPETFGNKNLKPYLKPYASIANPILLDYSKFRDTIQVMVKDADQLTDT